MLGQTIIFIDDETGSVAMKVRRISFKGELFLEQSLWTDRKLLKKAIRDVDRGSKGARTARGLEENVLPAIRYFFLWRGVMECKVPD